jgi:hypothetical protein
VICASPAASDKPTSASMPMVCAIHMGHSPGLRRPSAAPGQSRHGAESDSKSQNSVAASGLISGICAIHMGPPPDHHRIAYRHRCHGFARSMGLPTYQRQAASLRANRCNPCLNGNAIKLVTAPYSRLHNAVLKFPTSCG